MTFLLLCSLSCCCADCLAASFVLTGSTGCEAIAKALRNNSAVKELDVSHTSIDDKAANAISQMLTVNKELERIIMSHTNVSDSGAQLICNALQVR